MTGEGPALPDSDTRAIKVAAQQMLDFDRLRPGQKDAVQHVLRFQDTLAVMPTGSGKSAIYQMAGSMIEGPTVVVSPLIALQSDQVRSIDTLEVGGAVAINSTISESERRERERRLRDGEVEFCFLAPEQLTREETLEELKEIKPSLFVVDEAHCISEWGHDFRPDFLRLGAVIDALGHPVVLGLTATAAPPVRTEIVRRLRMRDPAVVVRGFDRPNIHLGVQWFHEDRAKRDAVLDAVENATPPGILYVATRADAEGYADALRVRGLRAAHYHGGMQGPERDETHEAFLDDDLDCVVATTAFGMGIDKPNVRFVIHAHVPESVDAYYQEVGRAGRDGDPAQATLFFRPEDLGMRTFFSSAGALDPDALLRLAVLVQAGVRSLPVSALADQVELSEGRLAVALSRLEDAGALRLGPIDEVLPPSTQVDPVQAAAAASFDEDARDRRERSRLEMMRAYAETDHCRGRFLLNYFGEHLDRTCGHCDRCDEGIAEEEPDEIPFDLGSRVTHDGFGEGTVVRYEDDRVVVLFDESGYRQLALSVVAEKDLLTPSR